MNAKPVLYPAHALYHTLAHFMESGTGSRESLLAAGYTNEQIDTRLRTPGSKFYTSFARSPQEAVGKLRKLFPASFATGQADGDGRLRLSFRCGQAIGTSGLIRDEELTPEERATTRNEMRNGCPVRTVRTIREFPTPECQLILEETPEHFILCTLFPGEAAPPLPLPGQEPDPFWKSHLFLATE